MTRLIVLVLAVALFPSEARSAEKPKGLPTEVTLRIRSLAAPEFETREESARWLIANRDRWRSCIPEHWVPSDPESRWRWRWIGRRVEELEKFRTTIGEDSIEVDSARVGRLFLEVGAPVLEELSWIAARHPRSRLRQRAVELLDRLGPNDLTEYLGPVAVDESPWVRRTLLDVAARHDRGWLLDLLRSGLREDPIDDPNLAETIRAVRVHRVGEFVDSVRAAWSDLGTSSRVEASLVLSARSSPEDIVVFYWMIESGDYRVIVDGVRAFEAVAARAKQSQTLDVGRFAEATLTSTFPEIRARARRFVEAHGAPNLALELVAMLEADYVDVRQFAAERIVAWNAEDYYSDLEYALLSWPPEERRLHLVVEAGEVRVVGAVFRDQ